ncbi:MAG: fused MFS/spermidine synthase [Verrucomicrobiota bacterium]
MTRDFRIFAIVLVCFLLSGIAALLYQTVWMRHFSILFGTSELAVVTVLIAYMGGLALGAATIGLIIDRLQRPILLYALLEIGIALSAALVPPALQLIRSLRIAFLGGLPELPPSMGFGQGFFFLASGFVILMIPTAFMGATLPLLAKGVIHSRKEIGKRVGLLYSINTLGAIIGTLAAAFYLIPALGLTKTACTGIALNILAGLLGLAAARNTRPSETPTQKPPPDIHPTPLVARILLPLMLISGALAFAYEVLWSRLLGIVVGGSMTAFATMLASFLLGITIGSAAASRFARTSDASAHGLALAQVGTAILSVAAFHLLSQVPDWASYFRNHGWSTPASTAFCSIVILLPSTICIGATFPFAVRVLATMPTAAASSAARIYSWNTVGAIVGAFLAGFFLIPRLGFAGMIALAATANFVLALIAYGLAKKTNRIVFAVGAVIILAATLFFRPNPPMEILNANRFATGTWSNDPSQLRFYDVGRSATVVTTENLGNFYLKTNGLPEATINRPGARIDPNNENWTMATLPLLNNLSAETMLVIGLGGGQILSAVPPKIKSIDVVELEEAVVAANEALAPHRLHDPLSDPRIEIVVNDARSALTLTDKKYDLIVSQPSHPWTAGASHLYTLEFFQEAAARLNPNGVFLQWIGTPFVTDELARSLMATFSTAFPSVRVYKVQDDLLLLGSTDRLDTMQDLQAAADKNGTILHYSGWPAFSFPEDVAATLLLDENAVARYSVGAPLTTDNNNLMATQSPKLINLEEKSLRDKGYNAWRDYDSLVHGSVLINGSANPNWSNPYLLWKIFQSGSPDRYEAILEKLIPKDQALARGFTAVTAGDFPTAFNTFKTVLGIEPDNRDALFYSAYSLLQMMPLSPTSQNPFADASPSSNLTEPEQKLQEFASSLPENDRLLLSTLFYCATAQWDKVRAADARIEEILTPKNLIFGLLTAQRARALLQNADPNLDAAQRRANAQKALALLDRALDNGFSSPAIMTLRGEAAALAGKEAEFINTVWSALRAVLSAESLDSPAARQNLRTVSLLMQKYGPAEGRAQSPGMQKLIEEIDALANQLQTTKSAPQVTP